MNILFLNTIDADVWGGGEEWMLANGIGLRKRGHNVFCAGRAGSAFLERMAEAGFPIYAIQFRRGWGPVNTVRLTRFLLANHIDAVIANQATDLRMAGVARKLANNPVLLARVGLAFFQNDWKDRLPYLKLADGIVANSHSLKRSYLDASAIADGMVRVIYNGVDTEVAVDYDLNAVRAKYDLPDRSPVIGIFGRLTAKKQHSLFLEVAKNVLDRHPEAIFLVVGEGPEKAEIQSYAKELGITEHLYMLGFQRSVFELYALCDVVLFTSEAEALPNVVIEAMLAGKPVVSFDLDSVQELIRCEDTGVKVPLNDIYLMSQRTLELIESPERRRHIGEAARHFIMEHFSVNFMVQEVEAYLDQLVHDRHH